MKTFRNTQKLLWYTIIWSFIKYFPCEAAPPCFSDIYCHGSLLETVQMARIYPDSKTFVDMKMKYSPQEIKDSFENFMKRFSGRKPNREEIKKFVTKHFEPPGAEFEDWKPRDWKPMPKFLNQIISPNLRMWASKLNLVWNQLGRKIKDEVQYNKDRYSLIWVPNPTIVPGGRFREFYYWDSYWIIKGLLLSEMTTTTKGMLGNFLYMVENYGLVPNGGRVYYLGRSQPPLLIPMINLYYNYTQDRNFISKNIKLMEKEFDYWMSNHSRSVTVNGVGYTLAAYGDNTNGPRPESYIEDVISGRSYKTDAEKDVFYSEQKAAAESGWDFSSRWFINNRQNKGNLSHTKTRSIIPVDLNAILYWNAKIIANFNTMLSNTDQAAKYNGIASNWLRAVTAVLWHDDVGAWLDYDLINNVRRNYFSPSNISPLWTGCYSTTNKNKVVESILRYLSKTKCIYPGGIPTTLQRTGEQWDFPNGWPPLQHMMIVGLHNTGHEKAMRLAYNMAWMWVHSNFAVFAESGNMFEKYDVSEHGASGHGGEYHVQLGFGWSNGVIMDLLDMYGHTMSGAGISLAGINSLVVVLKSLFVSTVIRTI